MKKDGKATQEAPKATGRAKGTPRPGRVERQERRMQKATMRRDLAVAEVRAKDGSFLHARGKHRAEMIARADRCEIQQERVAKKYETRRRLAGMEPKERAEARKKGEIQFGKKAPEYHRLRMTPEQLSILKKREVATKAHVTKGNLTSAG